MALVSDTPATREFIEGLLAERILVLDGAMGTMVHALKFGEADFRGSQFADHPKDLRNLIDVLCITQPEAIENIHRGYLEAGADIIETNTFGATSVALADFALENHVREINLAAAALARRGRRFHRTQSEKTAICGWFDRTDEQAAFDRRQCGRSWLSQRYVRSDGRNVLRASRGAGGWGRRYSVGRNRI